jgi:hypothetical protein
MQKGKSELKNFCLLCWMTTEIKHLNPFPSSSEVLDTNLRAEIQPV